MKNKALVVWVIALLLFGMAVGAQAESVKNALFSSGDWSYRVRSDGSLEIAKWKGEESELVIPSTIDGKKVSGVAQRIYKNRVLHHGTLLFDSDLSVVAAALKPSPVKFSSKSTKSVRSRVTNIRSLLPEDMSMEQFWQRLMTELSGEDIRQVSLTEEELQQVYRQAEEKYRSWDWTYGRSPQYSIANRRRFDGGTVEMGLAVKEGRIQSVSFLGDFMATEPNTPLEEALVGLPFEKEAVAGLLETMDLGRMFGAITAENLLELMFPEQEGEA